MGRGTPNGGRGAARNNNNYGNNRGGGNRNNKLDVSALGLVSPLGGAGLSSLVQPSLVLYSEEVLLLQAVSRTSWLGCVHSWEDRNHTT